MNFWLSPDDPTYFCIFLSLNAKNHALTQWPLIFLSLCSHRMQWRSQRGAGGGGDRPLWQKLCPPSCPPKWNYILYRGLWRAPILSPSQPPPPPLTPQPPLPPPHFEKSGYALTECPSLLEGGPYTRIHFIFDCPPGVLSVKKNVLSEKKLHKAIIELTLV